MENSSYLVDGFAVKRFILMQSIFSVKHFLVFFIDEDEPRPSVDIHLLIQPATHKIWFRLSERISPLM